MSFLRDRSTALALSGAALALLAGLSAAWMLVGKHRGDVVPPPPASQGGLVIDSSGRSPRADPARPLRCFVGGRLVGEMSLAECAQRNGVATDALDVGIDQTGALAAAQQAGPMLTPLPPPATPAPVAAAEPAVTSGPAALQGGVPGACWRFSDNQWRRLPADMPLGACVQTLFAGRCERPGEAAYARWAQQTLRLVAPGRVEVSADNHTFRLLADQSQGCPPA